MKKIFFLLAMLVSVVVNAQTLNIKITTIDYSTKIATCDLSWTGRNATHLSDVWVFVDYIEVSNNAPTGTWNPATITGATVTQNSTGSAAASMVSGNTRGVWIKSTTSGANFTGKIALQLSNVPANFNACAYATDYPPNMANVSSGTYTLKGTQSFIINGTTISGNQYTDSINSLTDPTGCPGCIAIRDFQFNAASVTIPCCPNLTAIGNYCRDLVADDASTYTACGIEIKKSNQATTCVFGGENAWCPTGWRYPTDNEGVCMCSAFSQLGMVDDGAWRHDLLLAGSNTTYGRFTTFGYCYTVHMEAWAACRASSGAVNVRCVR